MMEEPRKKRQLSLWEGTLASTNSSMADFLRECAASKRNNRREKKRRLQLARPRSSKSMTSSSSSSSPSSSSSAVATVLSFGDVSGIGSVVKGAAITSFDAPKQQPDQTQEEENLGFLIKNKALNLNEHLPPFLVRASTLHRYQQKAFRKNQGATATSTSTPTVMDDNNNATISLISLKAARVSPPPDDEGKVSKASKVSESMSLEGNGLVSLRANNEDGPTYEIRNSPCIDDEIQCSKNVQVLSAGLSRLPLIGASYARRCTAKHHATDEQCAQDALPRLEHCYEHTHLLHRDRRPRGISGQYTELVSDAPGTKSTPLGGSDNTRSAEPRDQPSENAEVDDANDSKIGKGENDGNVGDAEKVSNGAIVRNDEDGGNDGSDVMVSSEENDEGGGSGGNDAKNRIHGSRERTDGRNSVDDSSSASIESAQTSKYGRYRARMQEEEQTAAAQIQIEENEEDASGCDDISFAEPPRHRVSQEDLCQATTQARRPCQLPAAENSRFCKLHIYQSKSCQAFTLSGKKCQALAQFGQSFCRRHLDPKGDIEETAARKYPKNRIRCGAITLGGTPCCFQANLPSKYCSVHARLDGTNDGDGEHDVESNLHPKSNMHKQDWALIRAKINEMASAASTPLIRNIRKRRRCSATTSKGTVCRQLAYGDFTEFCRSHHIMRRRKIVQRALKHQIVGSEEDDSSDCNDDVGPNFAASFSDENDAEDEPDDTDKLYRSELGTKRCCSSTQRKTRCLYVARKSDLCFRHYRLRFLSGSDEEEVEDVSPITKGPRRKNQMANGLFVIPSTALDVRFETMNGGDRCKYTHGLGRCRSLECPFQTGYCYKHTRLTGLGIMECDSASERNMGVGAVQSEESKTGDEGSEQSGPHHGFDSDEEELDSSNDDGSSVNDGVSFASNGDFVDSDTCSVDQYSALGGSLASATDPQGVRTRHDRPYKTKEFYQLWKNCEDFCGVRTDEIESLRRVRSANNTVAREDTDGQLKAQYGRLLPRAMKKLIKEVFALKRDDVFLDIGHGIGNACLQAAFTVGCEARGIEVISGRHSVAQVFRDNLISQVQDHNESVDGKVTFSRRIIGPVKLIHGRLEDMEHQDFLTKGITAACVNNFNGVFAERSSKSNQKYFLDDYVAALFARMDPGAVLVSLHPLSLGPTHSEANAMRTKQGLEETPNASFYEMEQILLGKACDMVKWCQRSGNTKSVYVYKYTRVSQPGSDDGSAVFVCCNPRCPLAQLKTMIPATTKSEDGRYVINHCECRITTKNLRRRRIIGVNVNV